LDLPRAPGMAAVALLQHWINPQSRGIGFRLAACM
jgi:hypothetical protein